MSNSNTNINLFKSYSIKNKNVSASDMNNRGKVLTKLAQSSGISTDNADTIYLGRQGTVVVPKGGKPQPVEKITLPWTPKILSANTISIKPGSIDGNIPYDLSGTNFMSDNTIYTIPPLQTIFYAELDLFSGEYFTYVGNSVPPNDPGNYFYFPLILIRWASGQIVGATAIKNWNLSTIPICNGDIRVIPGG